jgi:hypothetical protein
MDFATTEAASQFIKLVSTVCPCTTTDRVPRANRGRPQASLTSAPSSRPRPTLKETKKSMVTQPKKAADVQMRRTDLGSNISANSDDSCTLPSGSSDPLREAPFPVHNRPTSLVTFDQTFPSPFRLPPSPSQNDISQPAISRFLPPSSQLFLPSTPIPSSSQMLPPTAPITPHSALQPGIQPPNTQPNVFLESLMRSPTLYDLSRPQLEAVVAQVIREDGFVKLVCADIYPQRVSWRLIFRIHLARKSGFNVEAERFRPEPGFLGHDSPTALTCYVKSK